MDKKYLLIIFAILIAIGVIAFVVNSDILNNKNITHEIKVNEGYSIINQTNNSIRIQKDNSTYLIEKYTNNDKLENNVNKYIKRSSKNWKFEKTPMTVGSIKIIKTVGHEINQTDEGISKNNTVIKYWFTKNDKTYSVLAINSTDSDKFIEEFINKNFK